MKLFDYKQKELYVLLGDLLDYDYNVAALTRDYSPANQVLYSYGGQKVNLHKDETYKLFEAIVFSDFLGIDKDKPNGLIQTELTKRINVHTTRRQYYMYGYGLIQYIRPSVTISKIEENNRFLQPTYNDSITNNFKTNNYLTPLQILNHQNLSLGVDINFLLLDNPEMKYVFEINGCFRFGRTSIQDSVRGMGEQNQLITSGIINEYGINHFLVYPEVSLHIMPEERFNFKLAWKPQYFISAFDEPKLLDGTTKWINSYEMIMNIKTGDKGKIFARWRLNNQWGEIEKHFHQIQLGYSFYILKRN